MQNPQSYYRDHWEAIEPERLEAYDQMFRWRPEMEPLIAPAEVASGDVVLDYGCGPGWLAIELARRVGPGGRVHGVDLNAAFLARAAAHARAEGVAERIAFHRLEGDCIPLADHSIDLAITKNVLEYVTDLGETLLELRRVLKPGGRLHAIDSDWGMLAVEPLGAEALAELFAAASIAYRTPLVGRQLYGALRASGYRDVRVKVVTSPDTQGHFAPIVVNMASYARISGRMPDDKIDRLLEGVRASITRGDYLLVLTQFLVTGSA